MRRPGPEEWKQLIAEYETSGTSHKDFVAKHDIALGTFQFWLYRTRKKAPTRSSESDSNSPARFLPIDVLADGIELELRLEVFFRQGMAAERYPRPAGRRLVPPIFRAARSRRSFHRGHMSLASVVLVPGMGGLLALLGVKLAGYTAAAMYLNGKLQTQVSAVRFGLTRTVVGVIATSLVYALVMGALAGDSPKFNPFLVFVLTGLFLRFAEWLALLKFFYRRSGMAPWSLAGTAWSFLLDLPAVLAGAGTVHALGGSIGSC